MRSLPKSLSQIFAAGVVLMVLFGGPVASAFAQTAPTPDPEAASTTPSQSVGLMAIPPRIGDDGSLVIKPGGTIQLEARVRNTSDFTVKVRTMAEDFIIGDDGLTPIPVTELTSSRWSLAQWIQIPTEMHDVAAGDSVNIPFVIHVPSDALPGGRYAMVMHQVEGATSGEVGGTTGSQTGVNQRVGSLVYLRIDGPVTEEANIRNLTVPGLIEYGPVPISYEVENLSDIHIRPAATITITNWFGKEVDTFAAETQNIFPFSQRAFKLDWEHVWGFGRYTVRVDASYGQSGKVAVASASFWMIPYTMIAVTILMIMSAVAILMSVRRHLHHRNDVTRQHISLLEEKIKNLESELPERP